MYDLLITHGSLALIVTALVVAGVGAPVSEDLLLLFAGAMVYRGMAPLPMTLALCMAGVLVGDVLLFTVARKLGGAALERRFFRRLLPEARQTRFRQLFERYGSGVVFGARYVAGLRAPVFAMAGIHGMPFKRFVAVDALALCISAPLMIGVGYFSSQHLQSAMESISGVQRYMALGVLAILAVLVIVRLARRKPERSKEPLTPTLRPV